MTSPLTPGTRLGEYEIVAPLGAGGMGEVYRARDPRLGRTVAIKLLTSAVGADARERLQREARAAAALNHPHICIIHEIAEHGGLVFIVMEHIEGQPLSAIAGDGLPPSTVVRYGAQIADAIAHAHERGIVHRDLKCANVMVTKDGRVKVLDFGIATLTGEALTSAATRIATVTDAVVGTAGYIAPEVLKGQPADRRSDIWALGIVLFEMASGRHPFRGTTASEITSAVLRDDPAPLPRSVGAPLAAIISRCLVKEPAARYQQAGEVRSALETVSLVASQVREAVPTRAEIVEATIESVAPLPFENLAPPHEPDVVRTRSGANVVGRAAPRAALRRAFVGVEAGKGQLIAVAGEPGVGKTTVVNVFLEDVSSRAAVARGRCSERLAGTEAYLPWLEALDDLMKNVPYARAIMHETAPAWMAQLNAGTEAAQGATQERLKRELTALFLALGRRRPVVLFFDDLHWADASTIDALAYVAARFDTARALVIVTYRPTDLLRAEHPFATLKLELEGRGLARDLPLSLLSHDDVDRLIAAECDGHALPGDLVRIIHGRTEGNPLFVTDLLRYLRDRGMIALSSGEWVVTSSLDAIERDLPASIRSMIQSKLDALGEDDHRLIAAAAVQGADFHACVVADAVGIDAADAEDRLETIERRHGLIALRGEEELPHHTLTRKYRFVHVLYQNVLYASIAPARRTSLCKAIAEALLSRYGDEPVTIASEVAILFESARLFDRAARFFDVAARHAARLTANSEVVALARRGLAAAAALPAGASRDEAELTLLLTLGPADTALRGWSAPDLDATFVRAQALAQQLGRSTQVFKALWGLFAYEYVRSNLAGADGIANRLLDVAERNGDAVCRMHAVWARACIPYNVGALGEARQLLERALSFDGPAPRLEVAIEYGQEPGAGIRVYQECLLSLMGHIAAAEAAGRRAIERARQVPHPFTLAYVLVLSTVAHLYRRDFDGARERAEEVSALADHHGFGFMQGFGGVFLAYARFELGDTAQIAVMQKALEEVPDSQVLRTLMLAWLADACRRVGRSHEAKRLLAEAEAQVERSGERVFIAEIRRITAETMLDESPEHAERGIELLHQAIDEARTQQATLHELRAALSLARLRSGRPGAAEARDLVAGLAARIEGDCKDLRDARTFLAAAQAADGRRD